MGVVGAYLAVGMLKCFLSSEFARPAGKILAIEEELRGPAMEGLSDILARIDLIEETPEALVIRDWKTSRSKWSTIQVESTAEQLYLYAALLRSLASGGDGRA
jgi:PD-(D/E)XK nuclease superfamily